MRTHPVSPDAFSPYQAGCVSPSAGKRLGHGLDVPGGDGCQARTILRGCWQAMSSTAVVLVCAAPCWQQEPLGQCQRAPLCCLAPAPSTTTCPATHSHLPLTLPTHLCHLTLNPHTHPPRTPTHPLPPHTPTPPSQVNPRMGGRGVHTINKLSTGVCMVTEQLLATCGLPCAPPRPAEPLACIGEYGVIAPRSGILADHAFIEVGVDDWGEPGKGGGTVLGRRARVWGGGRCSGGMTSGMRGRRSLQRHTG